MTFPRIVFGTPRKLPKASELPGRVAVLDIAFAAGNSGASFESVTKPLIDALGDRLAAWIDHHDHVMHAAYVNDPRFVLRTKAEHGACPEMVTPERVAAAGVVDTICCHTDFDGLCSAAKWIRGGVEPYPGADDDARAVDTRLGKPSERANVLDRALRARPRDDALRGLIVKFLADGANDLALYRTIERASEALLAREEEARRISRGYEIKNEIAFVQVPTPHAPYDKTLLLLQGQERARISIVLDENALTIAARFDSGIDLLAQLGLQGGMPTVVSVSPSQKDEVLRKLGWPDD
ncbi:MAG TPA: hypothetical protein VFG30_06735 [Polyangiales bacterium]|jgi:hypothetical protein|nr:hypothetical protein [Polyangiales bacterium]